MNEFLHELEKELTKIDELKASDGGLLKNKTIELAMKNDARLLSLVLKNKRLKKTFFTEIDGVLIFDKQAFLYTVQNKTFLPDSYTRYKNKIGLADEKDEFISQYDNVVLNFPYKDCVLAGGQTKDDEKGKEVFFNEMLSRDEIDLLFSPKAFCNAERFGKGDVRIHRDAEINKKRGTAENTITDNLIIKGNNLIALHSIADEFAGCVKLIYIDPPYNTGGDSFRYNDNFNHSTWLSFMKNRLEIARQLLKEDGVIFVQCDDNEQAYLKVLMDEIFGRENFVNCSIFEKVKIRKNSAKYFSESHEYVLIFAKCKEKWNRNLLPRKDTKGYKNPDNDPRGLWIPVPIHANHYYDANYKITKPNGVVLERPQNQSWRLSEANFKRHVKENRIWWGNGDSYPMIKKFLNEVQDGMVPRTIFYYEETGGGPAGDKALKDLFDGKKVFDNPKPEGLLQLILQISTQPSDIVLDFCLGSGTTAAVAHKMGRQYIGIEQMDYIKSIAVERLKKVIEGEAGGISKEVAWTGGGSFLYAELASLNETLIQEVRRAKTDSELEKTVKAILESDFVIPLLEARNVEVTSAEWKALSFDEKKKIAIDILDKNMLYIPYSERHDEDMKMKESDVAFSEAFYKG